MKAQDASKHARDDDGATSMQADEDDRVADFLRGMASAGASSRDIAEAITVAFGGIDQVLMPIIGARGVAALYKRSVHLVGQTHPWLPHAGEGIPTAMDLAALTTQLAQRTADEAAAVGALLLQTLHRLLGSLVGPSLTERLLRPVWITFLSGSSAQSL